GNVVFVPSNTMAGAPKRNSSTLHRATTQSEHHKTERLRNCAAVYRDRVIGARSSENRKCAALALRMAPKGPKSFHGRFGVISFEPGVRYTSDRANRPALKNDS